MKNLFRHLFCGRKNYEKIRLSFRRRGAFLGDDGERGEDTGKKLPRNREKRPHRGEHLHGERGGNQCARLRGAYLPHGLEENLGLRERIRGVQPIHELPCRKLEGAALQPSVQHEHVQQNLAGRGHTGTGEKKNRRAGFGHEGKNAEEP